MRNALRIIAVVGVLSVFNFEQSKAADAPSISQSTYASASDAKDMIPHGDEPGLLPLRASDRVQVPVIEYNDRAAVPQTSVEAIPTPTAFHAGGALLAGILLTRLFRKVRRA